jgi:hypothetical protein
LEEFGACWEGLEEPRTGNATLHHLHDLLMIALCSVICGGENETATVTARPPTSRVVVITAAAFIEAMIQPPNMSPAGLVWAGIANCREASCVLAAVTAGQSQRRSRDTRDTAWISCRGRRGDQGRGGRSREPASLPARPSRSPVAGVRSTRMATLT